MFPRLDPTGIVTGMGRVPAQSVTAWRTMSSTSSRSQRQQDAEEAFQIQGRAGIFVSILSSLLSPLLYENPSNHVNIFSNSLPLPQGALRSTAVGVGLAIIAHHTWPT